MRGISNPLRGRIGYTLIFYFVLLATVPIAILSFTVVNAANSNSRDQSINQLQLVEEVRTRDIEAWLENGQNILQLTRQDVRQSVLIYELLGEDPRASTTLIVNSYLGEKLEAQTIFSDFFLYTLDGQVRGATDRALVNTSVSEAPYFAPSLDGNYIQPPTYDPETGLFTMVSTQLVTQPTGEVVGVIAGHLNMAVLEGIMTVRSGLGDTGESYLVSSESRLITPSRDANYTPGQILDSTEGISAALDGEDASATYPSYAGTEVIGVYRWVPELQVGMLAEISSSEALDIGQEIQSSSLLVALVLGVVAVLIGSVVALRLTNPIRQLTETATQFAAGDYGRRANVQRGDELGQLASAFNGMAEDLGSLIETLEERVNARTKDLQLAGEVSRQITTILDLNALLQEVVQLTAENFSLYACAIMIFDPQEQVLEGRAGVVATESGFQKFQFGRIALDAKPSLIAQAARSQTVVTVSDVTQSPDYMQMAALSKTRSEAALPIRQGSQLIGIFDVQSTQPERFTDEMLSVLLTLADQTAIGIRNAQLFTEAQSAQQSADTANRVKSQFLASMSHELRTPLNSIINYSQFVSRGAMGPVNPKQQDAVNKVIKSGKHLLALINDVLDISKIESGSLELFIEEDVDLRTELQHVIATCESLVAEKPVTLSLQVDDDFPTFSTDRQRIAQVVLNLVSNACKFTEQGHVTVAARTRGHEVEISVADSGPGIPAADFETIFQPFVQSEAGLKHGGGTGLGLPISQRLVEAHGGRMWLESTIGVGTTFYFTLPVIAQPRPVSV